MAKNSRIPTGHVGAGGRRKLLRRGWEEIEKASEHEEGESKHRAEALKPARTRKVCGRRAWHQGYVRLTPLSRCWDKGSSHPLENLLCPSGMKDTGLLCALAAGGQRQLKPLSSLSLIRTRVLT